MSILDTLITDRTAADVERLRTLLLKGWQNMTAAERDEYLNGTTEQLTDANSQPLYDSLGEPLHSADGAVQKGAYNYVDLNRVESAVDYVADELVQADTDIRQYASDNNVAWTDVFAVPYDPADYSALTIKTDWAETDIPTATQMSRYITNIKLIQAAIADASIAWIPDTMDGLDYEIANNIEQLLKDVDTALAVLVEVKKGYIRSAMAVYYSGEIYSGEGEA